MGTAAALSVFLNLLDISLLCRGHRFIGFLFVIPACVCLESCISMLGKKLPHCSGIKVCYWWAMLLYTECEWEVYLKTFKEWTKTEKRICWTWRENKEEQLKVPMARVDLLAQLARGKSLLKRLQHFWTPCQAQTLIWPRWTPDRRLGNFGWSWNSKTNHEMTSNESCCTKTFHSVSG